MQSVPSLLPEASRACALVQVSMIATSPSPSTLPGSVLKEIPDLLLHWLGGKPPITPGLRCHIVKRGALRAVWARLLGTTGDRRPGRVARDSESESQRTGCAARPTAQPPQNPGTISPGCLPYPPETRPQLMKRHSCSPPPPSAPGSACREPTDCGERQDLRFRDIFGTASPGGESAGRASGVHALHEGRASAGKSWERVGGLGRSV